MGTHKQRSKYIDHLVGAQVSVDAPQGLSAVDGLVITDGLRLVPARA